ncbi:hypothetical protein O181_113358 [Austropuccinia psidii MF-1]|uniref:Integrase catalytic domain-containing protein n=1 Tax=Austropuccinia psidii MF-1 TaxID=1389203 RepID=A0A9Q3K2V9_9BASI|nr:hypothetical protein [Austropuccinia psidii MF-1]
MHVSYHQDDWNTWLPLAEFAYNNSDHSSTKQSPFFTVYGRDPQFDSVHITQDNPAGKYADKSRASPPYFNPGDMVWLSSKHIKSTRPTKNCLKLVGSISNLEESQYSCLPPQASISMEIHPPSLPYFPPGTSQDINNPKSASRASSSDHH